MRLQALQQLALAVQMQAIDWDKGRVSAAATAVPHLPRALALPLDLRVPVPLPSLPLLLARACALLLIQETLALALLWSARLLVQAAASRHKRAASARRLPSLPTVTGYMVPMRPRTGRQAAAHLRDAAQVQAQVRQLRRWLHWELPGVVLLRLQAPRRL